MRCTPSTRISRIVEPTWARAAMPPKAMRMATHTIASHAGHRPLVFPLEDRVSLNFIDLAYQCPKEIHNFLKPGQVLVRHEQEQRDDQSEPNAKSVLDGALRQRPPPD